MATKGYSARIRKAINSMAGEFTGKDIAKKLKIKYSRINAALYYLERTNKIRAVSTEKTGKRGRPRKVFISNVNRSSADTDCKQLPIVVK